LLSLNENGLFCAAGKFYIDPWRPVEKAVITHAHADHAAAGSRHYLAAAPGLPLFQTRLGTDISVNALAYGDTRDINGVRLSLHPSGHVLGAAQIRLEYQGEVWVVTGDFKRAPDPTTPGFEPLSCHTLIMESTFGLPIYRWQPPAEIMDQINRWWAANAHGGVTSILQAYALGKSQRVLTGLHPDIGPVFVHGAVERINAAYAAAGIELPPVENPVNARDKTAFETALVIAPPSAMVPGWLKRFRRYSAAAVSGWMQLRGMRRRRALDRGFVLSDHADWPGLVETVHQTGCEHVRVTHGYSEVFARYLREQGVDAEPLETPYGTSENDE